jgi:hypothetical protein
MYSRQDVLKVGWLFFAGLGLFPGPYIYWAEMDDAGHYTIGSLTISSGLRCSKIGKLILNL